MGKDVAARFPAARDALQAIDDALGVALSRLMFDGPEEALTQTHNAQPAILAHSAAVFAVVGPVVSGGAPAARPSLGGDSADRAAPRLPPPPPAKPVPPPAALRPHPAKAPPPTMAAGLLPRPR